MYLVLLSYCRIALNVYFFWASVGYLLGIENQFLKTMIPNFLLPHFYTHKHNASLQWACDCTFRSSLWWMRKIYSDYLFINTPKSVVARHLLATSRVNVTWVQSENNLHQQPSMVNAMPLQVFPAFSFENCIRRYLKFDQLRTTHGIWKFIWQNLSIC